MKDLCKCLGKLIESCGRRVPFVAYGLPDNSFVQRLCHLAGGIRRDIHHRPAHLPDDAGGDLSGVREEFRRGGGIVGGTGGGFDLTIEFYEKVRAKRIAVSYMQVCF